MSLRIHRSDNQSQPSQPRPHAVRPPAHAPASALDLPAGDPLIERAQGLLEEIDRILDQAKNCPATRRAAEQPADADAVRAIRDGLGAARDVSLTTAPCGFPVRY